MKKWICLLAVTLLLCSCVTVYAFQPYEGYTYDEWDKGIPAAVGYGAAAVHYGDTSGEVLLKSPQDICIDEEGRLFILESWERGVVILNNDFSLVREIRNFTLEDGTEYYLTEARGIAVSDGKMIIADYENMCLVVSDLEGHVQQIIEKPENPVFPADMEFRPYAVATDADGNIYALVLEVYQGAAVFTPEGEFKGFYGNNKVSPTLRVLADRFWKSLMSAEQREQMANYVPLPPQNFDITKDGFMYCCTVSSEYGDSNLRCINPFGQDVWKGESATGDLEYATQKGQKYVTEFADVSVSESGYVYALDSTMSRIFMFDPDHNLVFSFGGLGEQNGTFSNPLALETYGRSVYVLDSTKGSITVFEPTAYGTTLMDALDLYRDSRYEECMDLWEEVLRQNGNARAAYNGIGNALLYSGQYREAMTYFQQASNRVNESRAFELYRGQLLRRFFPFIIGGIALVAVGLVALSLVKRVRRVRGKQKAPTPAVATTGGKRLWREFARAQFHPVETFEEMGYKKTGSVWIAGLFVLLFFLFTLMERHLLAFRFNTYTVENTNVLLIFISTALLVVLAVVTNWGLSTLWDGKANMRLIWVVFGYSLAPYVCGILVRTLLSGFLTIEEGAFTSILTTVCLLWTGLLLWFGLLQTQEFTVKKNILCLLCTAAGMMLLLILGFLVMLLFQELFSFISEFGGELFQRIR